MKFVENPDTIRITQNSGTIILLAGVQGSGKSFFAQKHFDSSCIISCDDIFYDEFKASGLKDLKSTANFEKIHELANIKAGKMVEDYSKSKPYVVFDSVGYNNKEWLDLIEELKQLYTNIVLIVLQPSLAVAINQLSQREKMSRKREIGMTAPDSYLLALEHQLLEITISSKVVGYKTSTTYVIRNPNAIKVIIE